VSASEIVTTPGHVFYERPNTVTSLIGPHAVGGATISVRGKIRGKEQLHGILHETPYMARPLVFLSLPAMQRWIVKYFLQARSL
jgi:hypothetical protein